MFRRSLLGILTSAFTILCLDIAHAGDPIKVGVFPVNASLPYYVALKRGYFSEVGLEPQTVQLGTPMLIVQALISGEIDAASNLVTLEGANINARRPDTLSYVNLIGQNRDHVFEQFVVRAESPVTSLQDLKGKRIFTSPGPANIASAKSILAKVGLKDGTDYQMQEQPLNVQLGALKSGNFEGGYTLEPVATIMIKAGVARRVEAGVMSTYLLGDSEADTYAAGAAVSGSFLKSKPKLAAKFAQAIAKAVADINTNAGVRSILESDLNVPAAVVNDVPLPHFIAVKDMSEKQVADFQKFIDVGVSFGVVSAKVDVKTMLAPL